MTLEQSNYSGRSLAVSLVALGEGEVRYALVQSGMDAEALVSACDLQATSAAIAPVVTARLNDDKAIGTLLPNLTIYADKLFPNGELSVRARNVLAFHKIAFVGQFEKLTVGQVWGLKSAGVQTVNELVSVAVRLHLEADSLASPSARKNGAVHAGEVRPPLATEAGQREAAHPQVVDPAVVSLSECVLALGAWAVNVRGAKVLGDVLAIRNDLGPLPDDIQAAVLPLLGTSIEHLRQNDVQVQALLDQLLGSLEERDRDIFVSRMLSDDPPTLESLGILHELTKEGVRQIVSRACNTLHSQLARAANAPLRWRLQALSAAIRNGVPQSSEHATRALGQAFRGLDGTPRRQAFLLWLAGPYSLRSNWLLREGLDAPKVPKDSPLFNNTIFITESAVARWLEENGFLPELAIDVMRGSALRQFGEQWVKWPGSLPDKAAVVLALLGRPAEPEEIAAMIGEGAGDRFLRTSLGEDDPIMRVGKRKLALREWGYDEYLTIAEEISRQIEQNGGLASIQQLIDGTADLGVKDASVRIFAEAPKFVIEEDKIRLRRSNEPYQITQTAAAVAGFFPEATRDRVHLRVSVGPDLIRGSGMQIKPALAKALGAVPGCRRLFTGNAGGQLAVGWKFESPWPNLGSLRALAKAAGAESGDTMLLTFDLRMSEVHARRITTTDIDVAGLTGLTTEVGRELEAVAASLGCDRSAVRETLAARGDLEVLAALA